jgi:VCBS repeat-containing protein
LLNDSDIDDDVLVIASINGEIDDTKDVVGEYGELNWNSDGTYIYTPHSELDTLAFGESVVETFTQTISDGNGGTTTATLSITINGVNDAPIFANDINSTIKSAAIDETDGSGSLLINDRDIDGNVLTVTQIETATTTAVATSTGIIAGEYGTLTWLADGTYDYNPNIGMDSLDAGEIVVETFIYTASDGLESGSATLTITISGANVAPVLADDSNSTLETDVINTVLDGFGNVTDNDTDDNGDALAITNIDGTPTSTGIITGQYGTLEWLADGEYIYTPNTELDSLTAGENVTDDFILTISDGNGEGGTTTLTITINGENDLPLLVDDTNSTIEILAVNQGDGSGNILDNDTDLEGSTLSIAEINGISNPSTNVVGTFGSLDWDEDGNYVYTPNSDLDSLDLGETVTETFIVSVSDGNGGFAESTLTITISGANDAPIAQNDTNSTIEILVVNDLVGSGTLLQNDNDVDGDIISILNIDGITSPSSDVVGTYGSLNWEADGSYIYTPNADMDSLAAGESVDDVFIYTISDGNGASDTATLTISISGENAAPVLVDDTNLTTEEDIITNADGSGTLLYNDIDPDGQLLLVSEIEGESDPLIDIVGTYGTLNWNIDGTYAYTPNDGLDSLAAGEDVADVFTYTATDGTESATAVLTITVRGANTDPVLLADTNATIKTTSVDEDDANSSGNILVNDNDPDGDVLEIYSIGGELTGTSVGTYGSLIWNPDGTYTYIPNSGMDSLSSSDIVYEVYTYVAVDNKGGSSISTLTITITGEN